MNFFDPIFIILISFNADDVNEIGFPEFIVIIDLRIILCW